MKKTKLYAKKTLSVFMAAMMLMTAWVFVAPSEADAASASAKDISGTNTTAIGGLAGLTSAHGSSFTYGTFGDEDDGTYMEKYTESYKNVLWAGSVPKRTSSNDESAPAAFLWGMDLKNNDAGGVAFYYPEVTFLYEGPNVKTRMGAVMRIDAYNRMNIRTYGGYITNGNGMAMDESWWINGDGRPNFKWAYWNHYTNSSRFVSTTNGTTSGNYATIGSNGILCVAAHMTFSGTMSDTEYVREIMPKFAWQGMQQTGDSMHTISNLTYTNKYIRVINYVPLKNALTKAVELYNEISKNPAKYTVASVSDFAKLAKALNAAKPLNYVNASKNDYSGYASAAKTAVDNWNKWINNGGLKVQQYTLSYKKYDGTVVKSDAYDYGTTVNCQQIAPANSVTQIAGNDSQHQTYYWHIVTNNLTITDDEEILEKINTTEYHTFPSTAVDAGANHTKECSVCGYVVTANHSYQTNLVSDANCEEPGEKEHICTECGNKKTETIPATGHDFTSGIYAEKESGKDGTHYQKCKNCGKYGWEKTEDACEGHNWKQISVEPSKCNEQGKKIFECTVCKATYEETLDLAAHTVTATPAVSVEGKCGAEGNEAFWSCSVCNRVWKDEALTDEVTDLTDNDGDKIPDVLETKGPAHKFDGGYKNAESGEQGSHYRVCSICKNAYGLDGETNKTEPHKFDNYKVITPATCLKKGTAKYTCSDCGNSYEEDIATIAHETTHYDKVEAKCGVAGNVEYYHCSLCNKNYEDAACTVELDSVVIAALIHKWTEHHDYDTIKDHATCMTAAVYNNHCDYCKVRVTGTHSYGDVDKENGHKFDGEIQKNEDGSHSYKCTVTGCNEYGNPTTCEYEVTADVDSTCKTPGYTSYKCADCGHSYSIAKDIDPNNHTGEGTYIIATQDPTCATLGSTGIEKCSGCNAVLSSKLNDLPVDSSNHEDMKKYDAKDSTCQEEGWKAYEYCSACQTYKTDKVTVEKKAHKFTSYVTNNNGTHTAICDTCAEGTEKATDVKNCTGGTANCVDAAICATCNSAYGTTNSANHKTVITVAKVDSTCQTEGTEAYKRCDACDTNIDEPKAIAKKDHKWGSWSKVEDEDKHVRSCTTCKADVADVATEEEACSGGVAYCNAFAVCGTCKAAYGKKNAANHETQAWHYADNKKEATCQAEGYTGDKLFDCCNAIKDQGTVIEAAAHKFTIEVSRTPATCKTEGTAVYKCSTCVESEGVKAEENTVVLPIDTNNHESQEKITVGAYEANCTTDGFTGDVYHACCYSDEEGADNRNALIERGEKIKANGRHKYISSAAEYMLDLDEDGNIVVEDGKLKVVAQEPDYTTKIGARHADGKWYHAQLCELCNQIVYEACYTYAHTYNCVDTDICEVCKGLCSLVDADKHKGGLIEVEGYAATCQTEGRKSYYKCKHCNETYLDAAGNKEFDFETEAYKLKIAKSSHSFDWNTPSSEVEATCGQAGTQIFTCTVDGCNETTTRSTGSATGKHTWVLKITDEATCSSSGYKAYICSECDTVKPNSYVTIPTVEHNYDADGNGKVDRNDAAVVPGTSCINPGTLTFTCKECGFEKVEADTENESGHDWDVWVKLSGDCATGVVMQRQCKVEGCGAKEQERRETDTHEYVLKAYVEPTAEADGYKLFECANCGGESREVVPFEPSEGGEGDTPEVPDTPDTPEEPEEPEDPADKHMLMDDVYVTVKEATCSSPEIRRYTCISCGEIVEKEYGEPLDHVWIEQAEEIATCTRPGHSAYYKCVRINCEAEYGAGKIVYPAKNHTDGDGNGKCDYCNSLFYTDTAGTKLCDCLCHNDGFFMKIIYKIVSFIWKLFKINNACACGAVHY